MSRIARRAFLAGISVAAGAAACSRHDHAAPSPPEATPPKPLPPMPEVDAAPAPRGQVGTQTWVLSDEERAVAIVPAWGKPADKYPLLVALHGRGEAAKGPAEGVLGWPRDYALLRAIDRVCAPPLVPADLENFVDPKRLAKLNEELAARPFAGLVIVCPYLPDVDLRKPKEMKDYGDYLLAKIIPKARKELPVIPTAASTGIDGVSLGGAEALRVGLWNADAFGAVGTLQPAIQRDQVAELTEMAKAARAKNPKLALRLLTSSDDYFRQAISDLDVSLKNAGIAHDYADVPGPHDYPFNRGPGSIEMLLWHDRVLAR